MTEKKRGRPALVTVRVVQPMIQTSKGTAYAGDDVSLTAQEVAELRKKGKVK